MTKKKIKQKITRMSENKREIQSLRTLPNWKLANLLRENYYIFLHFLKFKLSVFITILLNDFFANRSLPVVAYRFVMHNYQVFISPIIPKIIFTYADLILRAYTLFSISHNLHGVGKFLLGIFFVKLQS